MLFLLPGPLSPRAHSLLSQPLDWQSVAITCYAEGRALWLVRCWVQAASSIFTPRNALKPCQHPERPFKCPVPLPSAHSPRNWQPAPLLVTAPNSSPKLPSVTPSERHADEAPAPDFIASLAERRRPGGGACGQVWAGSVSCLWWEAQIRSCGVPGSSGRLSLMPRAMGWAGRFCQ